MPATVTLEENGHVLHFVFQDPVTFQEFIAVEQQANHWSDTSQYNLHSFMDVRKLRRLPEGILRIRHTAGSTNMKAGNTAILGASMYVQAMAETIFKLTRNTKIRFFTASEADKAIDYLRQI